MTLWCSTVTATKKGSIYLVAKGGLPNQAHQQMDCGTFIVESDGVLWTEDLRMPMTTTCPVFGMGNPVASVGNTSATTIFSHNVINIDHSLQYANGHAFCLRGASRSQAAFRQTELM